MKTTIAIKPPTEPKLPTLTFAQMIAKPGVYKEVTPSGKSIDSQRIIVTGDCDEDGRRVCLFASELRVEGLNRETWEGTKFVKSNEVVTLTFQNS